MAETRESYIAGDDDTAAVPTGVTGAAGTSGSSMRDMDRMLDETLGTADPEDRRAYVDGGDTGGTDSDPDDPDVTRSRIERTRARMSETIDEIEDALLRKKESLQERLNVFSPVQHNPLPSIGIAFGAGLLLGFLTGGDDDDTGPRPQTADDDFWSRRASDWENRARRLLELAQRQEVELSELRGEQNTPRGFASSSAGRGTTRSAYTAVPDDSYQVDLQDSAGSQDEGWERVLSPIRNIGDTVVEGLTGFLTRAARELTGSQGR